MKILEFDKSHWNVFQVILKKQKETEPEYLKRLLNCTKEFYTNYTIFKPILKNPLWIFKEGESFGGNFADFYLEKYCDVKFNSRSNGTKDYPEGIHIHCHYITNLKPSIEFLKEKWKEFQYS